MESVRTEQEVMAEQVSALAAAGAKRAACRCRQLGRVMWQMAGIVSLVALAAVGVLAEMWLLTRESRLAAVGGLFFFTYLFLVGAFATYCFFFSRHRRERQ